MAQLARQPAWLSAWAIVLTVTIAAGLWLLSSGVGAQAVVDERVRVIEAFGGRVSDEQYAQLQAAPPWWVFVTSGSRTLLTPPVTLLVALGVWLVARFEGAAATLAHGLSVAVHASTALVVGQLVATPLHYVRESLTSPLNLATLLPLLDDGSVAARFFGTIDVFVLWWMVLVGVGVAALTGRKATRYLAVGTTGLVVFAAAMAGVMSAMGGN